VFPGQSVEEEEKKTVFATKESFKMHFHSFIFAEKVFAPSLTFVLRAETDQDAKLFLHFTDC
jgi:hypothetical protein